MDNESESDELLNQPSTSGERESDGKLLLLLSGAQDNYFRTKDASGIDLSIIKREIESGKSDSQHDKNVLFIQESNPEDYIPENVSPESSNPVDYTPQQSGELINQFLKGDIDFSQYAQQMSVAYTEAGEDEETPELEAPSTSEPKSSTQESPSKKKSESSRSSRGRALPRKLPRDLKGLIGQANVCYARGDKEAAIDMCLEVIRQHPQASEPFFTLSHIYEDSGETDRAMQMSLIGAHLNPSDKDIWLQLAEKSEKVGNIKQAITCYTQALRKDWCLELLNKRAELQLQLGDKKSYLRSLLKMVDVARSTQQFDQDLEVSKKVAEYYFHEENDYDNAKKALETSFIICSKNVKFVHINLYLELLILTKDFGKCMEVMVEYCGLEFMADVDEQNNSFSVVSISIPSDMMVDILAKLIVALILMKSKHLFDQIFPCILKYDPNDAGDLFLDIAETLISENLHADALKFLNPLTASQNFSLPAVWIRKAECLTSLGRYRDAIEAYEVVLEKVPLHNDARLALVDLLTKLGDKEDAIKVLSFNIHETEADLKLTYEKCMLLKGDKSKEREFIRLAELILYRHFGRIRNLDEKGALAHLRSSKHRIEAIIKIRKLRNEIIDDEEGPIFHEMDETPTLQQEYELFIDLCNLYIRNKVYHAMQRLTFSALISKKFVNKPDLGLFAFIGCFFNQDGSAGFDFGRALLAETNHNSSRMWNLMSVLFAFVDHQRVYKYLTRLTSSKQGNYFITQLKANCCLMSHIAHKFALNDFALLYQKYPDNALLAFLTALCFTQLVCQKYSSKHLLFSQGIAFLSKYIENRGEECKQEIHYNVGRLFHQVSLLHLAVHHYNLALQSKPAVNSDMLDLKREIAYNLHLIYLESGEVDLATSIIEQYVII